MSELIFRLPDVGEGLAEAEIIDWLVGVGDQVRADQPVLTVETAKAQVELPAPADGVVRELIGAVGDIVPVGEPLFVLGTAARTTDHGHPVPDVPGLDVPVPSVPDVSEPETTRRDDPATGRRRVLAAPSTRRLAVELDIDITVLTGTGPNGRVTTQDVRDAAGRPGRAAPTPASPVPAVADTGDRPGSETHALRGLRRQIAKAMDRAWQVPHITEFREIDATMLELAHRELRATADPVTRLTVLPLLIRTVIAGLRRHPRLNATLDMAAERYELHHRHHIGVAAATPDGLIVPVLRDAGRYSIKGLGREVERLADAARARTLSVEETSGGTFTISNFGSYGTWLGTPLVNAPQVAIAGFGRIREAVVPVDGAPAVRRVLPVAVSADHRLIDGAELGAFVNTLERLIRSPLALLGEED